MLFQYKTNICFKLKHLLHLSNKSQRILQAHYQSPTSQDTDQSFAKKLANPTQKEKQKIPRFAKIKSATHLPTDKRMDEEPLLITAVWRNGGGRSSYERLC